MDFPEHHPFNTLRLEMKLESNSASLSITGTRRPARPLAPGAWQHARAVGCVPARARRTCPHAPSSAPPAPARSAVQAHL